MRLVSDIDTWELFTKKDGTKDYLVGSIQMDKYIVVPEKKLPVVHYILNAISRGQTPAEIEEDLKKQGIATNVEAFCKLLARKGLLELDGAEDSEGTEDDLSTLSILQKAFGMVRALTWDIASIPLDGLRGPLMRLGVLPFVLLMASAVLTTVYVISLNPDFEAMRQLVHHVRKGIVFGLLLNIFVLPFSVLFHEMGHAITAARSGKVYPRRLYIRLFLTVPYFSIQLPGLYTLPLKDRVLTILSGPLMDLVMGNVMYIASLSVHGDIKYALVFLAFANYMRFLFNILPILPMSDGYVLMSHLVFKDVDIRSRVAREFGKWRKRKPNNFGLSYTIFFLANNLLSLFFLVTGLLQIDAYVFEYLARMRPSPYFSLYSLLLILLIDVGILFFFRKRLRFLFIWA